MNDIQKRFSLFSLCVVLRVFIAYLAKHASHTMLRYMGYVAVLPAIGFMYIWMTGSRKTGGEVMGGKIWWNDLRPVHGLLYSLFAYTAIMGKTLIAWKFLLADVIIGLVAMLHYHWSKGNIDLLFV